MGYKREAWRRDKNRIRGSKIWLLITSTQSEPCSPRGHIIWEDGRWEALSPSRWPSSFTRKGKRLISWLYWMRGYRTPMRTFEDENFEATLLADFIRYFGLSLEPRELVVRSSERRIASPCARACEGGRPGAVGCRRFSSASFHRTLQGRFSGHAQLRNASLPWSSHALQGCAGACGTGRPTPRWAGATGLRAEWRSMSFRAITRLWFTSLTSKVWPKRLGLV